MNHNKQICKLLRGVRKQQGITQRELSTRTGITQSHIAKFETGNVDIRISSMLTIANALGLTLHFVPHVDDAAVRAIADSATENHNLAARKELARILNSLMSFDDELLSAGETRELISSMQRISDLQPDNSILPRLRKIRSTIDYVRKLRRLELAAKSETKLSLCLTNLQRALKHAGKLPAALRRQPVSATPAPMYGADG